MTNLDENQKLVNKEIRILFALLFDALEDDDLNKCRDEMSVLLSKLEYVVVDEG